VIQATPAPALGFERPTFDEIYTTTWRLVWSSARHQGVPHSAIADVAQDVFVAVYRQLHRFSGQCSQQTWVLAILKRVVSNYHRTRRRKGAGHALSSEVSDPELLVDDQDLFELLSDREAGRIVQGLAERLGDKRGPLFLLAELEGLTAAEISERTQVNVNTVNSRLRIGRLEFSRLVDSFRHHEHHRTANLARSVQESRRGAPSARAQRALAQPA
jgi:RNA polymerase sigma-70 factor (ECF subfamily)